MNSLTLPTQYRVACHTDNVGPGTTFVAISGAKKNGISFIERALDLGAREIVVEHNTELPAELIERCQRDNVTLTICTNARRALAHLSQIAYNYPARKLKIIGVTGTKGKTTSVYLLRHILQSLGKRVALLSGVENKIGDQSFPSQLTTAQPDYLHMFFDQCVQAGIEYVVMEAAAQAFTLHRLEGLQFEASLFTNFSMEHAEFYTTIDDYFEAKRTLATMTSAQGFLSCNTDEAWLLPLAKEIFNVRAFSMNDADAPVKGRIIHAAMQGVELEISAGGKQQRIAAPALIGRYNAYNLLGIISTLHHLGVELSAINNALQSFEGVPGRLERFVTRTGVTCVVDYAHNPSSYEAVLSTLAQCTHQLLVVFGCGGERAHDKRPVMGALATAYAKHVFLTADNPRTEDLTTIIAHIMAGISDVDKVTIEPDRARAIEQAIAVAEPGAIVAVLGKGPDEYQQFGTEKIFFSDRQEVLKNL